MKLRKNYKDWINMYQYVSYIETSSYKPAISFVLLWFGYINCI